MTGVGAKVTGVSWLVAGALAAWAAARAVGADRVRAAETATVPLLSLTPQVAAVAPAAVLALRLAGRRGPAGTAAVAATALSLLVRPRGAPRRQPEAAGATLRVVTMNLYYGRAHAESVVARVRQADADVLFVQELTADAVTRLKQAGLEDLLPHTQLELRLGRSRGSGIYSRFPLGEGPPVPPLRAAHPTALVELPGGQPVELICAHPAAPALARGGAVRWRTELGALPPPGERPRLIAGDFNATLDHAAFRDVLRLGYADAARQTGAALTRTWGPPGKRALLTLDHVLVSPGCAVLDCSVHVIPGSDHRALYAQIRLPADSR